MELIICSLEDMAEINLRGISHIITTLATSCSYIKGSKLPEHIISLGTGYDPGEIISAIKKPKNKNLLIATCLNIAGNNKYYLRREKGLLNCDLLNYGSRELEYSLIYLVYISYISMRYGISCNNITCFFNKIVTKGDRQTIKWGICSTCKNELVRFNIFSATKEVIEFLRKNPRINKYTLPILENANKEELLSKSLLAGSPDYIMAISEKGLIDNACKNNGLNEIPSDILDKMLPIKILEKNLINDFEKPIIEIAKGSVNLDTLLYLSKKRYRDHYQHQFFVGSLGEILLNIFVNDSPGETLIDYIINKLKQKYSVPVITESDIKSIWWTAALIHDHALPLAHIFETFLNLGKQKLKMEPFDKRLLTKILQHYVNERLYSGEFIAKLTDIINKYYISFNIKAVESDIIDYLSNLIEDVYRKDGIANISWSKYHELLNIKQIKDIYPYDHGLWSVGNLILKCKETGLVNKCWQLKEVVESIALHNLKFYEINNKFKKGAGIRISVSKNPLGFLLRLCDSIHEWSRPIMVKGESVIESGFVVLKNLIPMNNNQHWSFPSVLTIAFEFMDANILKKTNWSQEQFIKSKTEELGYFQFPASNFRPMQINYQISVPFDTKKNK